MTSDAARRPHGSRPAGGTPKYTIVCPWVMGSASTDDAAALLASVRHAAGLTQKQLADRPGVAQSMVAAYETRRRQPTVPTLRRLLQAAGATLQLTADRGRPVDNTGFTARSAAEAIRHELAAGDESFALRLLVDAVSDLRRLIDGGNNEQVRRFLAAPPSTGSNRFDTLLAAQVGRELRLAGIRRPKWTVPPPLEQWWFVDATPVTAVRTMQRTSPDLSCVGIWIDDNAFNVA